PIHRETPMQTETYDYLLQWTGDLHSIIADRLEEAMTPETDQRTRWLMEYIAGHERELAATVRRYREQAAEAASRTWLYEHIAEDVPPNSLCVLHFDGLDVAQSSTKVFALHGRLIEVYSSMRGRAPMPAAEEVMDIMLTLEEGATRRLAEE